MDNINSIPGERENLAVHVDLCAQRWEAAHKKMEQFRVILIMLLIEATLSLISAFVSPQTGLAALREAIRALLLL